jgi:hypothetical protein
MSSTSCALRARNVSPRYTICAMQGGGEIVQSFFPGSIIFGEGGPEMEKSVGGTPLFVVPRWGMRPRKTADCYAPWGTEVQSIGMRIMEVSMGRGMGPSPEARVGSYSLDPASNRSCEGF